MHFLAATPMMDSPDRQPEWLKWGLVLTWLPKLGPTPWWLTQRTYTVALILFEPPVEAMERLVDFALSPAWTDATVDPYVLVDIALVSWYHRIDKVSWEVTDLVRADEEDVFRRTRTLGSTAANTSSPIVVDFDLHQMHTSAKNAVFMLEALDAAIRLSDAALSDHEAAQRGTSANDSRVWLSTHHLLRHRHELFHSLKLRTVSCQARIKNTVDLVCNSSSIDLSHHRVPPLSAHLIHMQGALTGVSTWLTKQAFHINIAHDSRVNLRNSRSVRLISIVGLIFIPFGAITAIFGTQFFNSSGDGHVSLSSDFWILWVIAIPVTVVSLAVWRATERGGFRRHWESALSSVPRWWVGARKWVGRERRGETGSDAFELRDASSQLV